MHIVSERVRATCLLHSGQSAFLVFRDFGKRCLHTADLFFATMRARPVGILEKGKPRFSGSQILHQIWFGGTACHNQKPPLFDMPQFKVCGVTPCGDFGL